MQSRHRPLENWPMILILGIAAGIANNIVILKLVFNIYIGLYLDMIFTIAVTFLGGLIPGLISAVLTSLLYGAAYYGITGTPYYWPWYFFCLCSAAAVFLVRLFSRFFPEECESQRIPGKIRRVRFGPLFLMLTALSLVMCVVVSVSGGLISICITALSGGNVLANEVPPEAWFRLGLVRQGLSQAASEILGRIPINMVERPITVFGGYSIALLVKKIYCRYRREPAPPAAP